MMGVAFLAYVLVKTDNGKIDVVLDELYDTFTEEYAIVVKLSDRNIKEVSAVVAKVVHQIKNLKETNSLVCAEHPHTSTNKLYGF